MSEKHDKDWLQGIVNAQTDYEGCKALKRLRGTSWAVAEPRSKGLKMRI